MMFKRAPDFVIGEAANPYLFRWWVIPRNPYFNVYLHKIVRSDDDRALHDHPWWNLSLVLRGGYLECTPRGQKWRGPGSLVFRAAKALHRLEVGPASWSLFLTGPRFREWGFACPQGWRRWQEFTAPTNKGAIGRGCGEP